MQDPAYCNLEINDEDPNAATTANGGRNEVNESHSAWGIGTARSHLK